MVPHVDHTLRTKSSQFLYLLEASLYVIIGGLLSVAAVVVLFNAGATLWRGIASRASADFSLQVLDQLLIVLVLVEILHTVRISIRSKEIILEPFLIVGLIASIRRVLVITMEAAKLTGQGHSTAEVEMTFRNSMIELALLGFLVFAFVFSIYFLRRAPAHEDDLVKESG